MNENQYSERHPHGWPSREMLDTEGRCMWCRTMIERDQAQQDADALAEALRLHLAHRRDAASFHEDFQSPSFLKACGRTDVQETHEEWFERVLYGPSKAALAAHDARKGASR